MVKGVEDDDPLPRRWLRRCGYRSLAHLLLTARSVAPHVDHLLRILVDSQLQLMALCVVRVEPLPLGLQSVNDGQQLALRSRDVGGLLRQVWH